MSTQVHGTFLDLVCRARADDRVALGAIAEEARPRVYAFIRRLLVDGHAAEDLTQETVLAIISSIGGLRRPEQFWSWVFSIAYSQVQQHLRRRFRRRAEAMFDGSLADQFESTGRSIPDVSQRELADLTRQAMTELTFRHRTVLVLRIFEDLPHAEVARVLGCSELSARVAFFHAKRALKNRLSERGVDGRMLAVALTMFGVATLPSSAPAASATVSMAAVTESALVGLLSAKAKVACGLGLLLMATVSGWGLWGGTSQTSAVKPANVSIESANVLDVEEAVTADLPGVYVHYTSPWSAPASGSREGTHYKHWYYLPDGPSGSVFYRIEQWAQGREEPVEWHVQNAEGRYLVDPQAGVVHVLNYQVPHGICEPPRVPTLPTDPALMCAFIVGLEGDTAIAMADRPGLIFERNPETGWVKRSVERVPGGQEWTTTYDYAPFDQNVFEVGAGSAMQWMDERNALFRQGWGFLQVTGELGGLHVEGWGRLPFVYKAMKTHSPYLELRIGDRWRVVDDTVDALLLDVAGRVVQRSPGGSFFKGLPRPWLGFDPLDLARRDFARQSIWFSDAIPLPEGGMECSFVAESELHTHPVKGSSLFDERTRRLKSIAFHKAENGIFDVKVGRLEFSYHADLPSAGSAAMPGRTQRTESEKVSALEPQGALWPVYLADALLQLDADILADAK